MPALASELRKTLESTVVDARDKAERGARDALTALAVAASEPYASMSEAERKLRNRLRARGRQLGDQRDPQKGTQSIERLVREMAYEHWHRMLFARFLAENQLLIEPSSGVAITLDECEELAAEEGIDLWAMAAQFAQEMLPQIFRMDDPVLALKLPLEIRQQLQGLVAGLATEMFKASDSLGWTYQFWQTKRKKEVNDSGVKIGADEISPVTQLFTEVYMVDFLLDNTLGAWHAGKMLAANPEMASAAQTEDELRQAVALPGCAWSYLRFIKGEDGAWKPAAGTYEGWPSTAAELKCLDPCMGSGHFVVAMFERLLALRKTEECLDEKAAVSAVIEENLFGLEIDPRCTQIAAFNLGLTAWQRVGYCKLPAVNLACSGLAPNAREADWLEIAGDDERVRNGMGRLFRMFQQAPFLGSLIKQNSNQVSLLAASFQELRQLLSEVQKNEAPGPKEEEASVTAQGIVKAAEIMADDFTLVTTNVPYLGRGKQHEKLALYCGRIYQDSKANLAACFVQRCIDFCELGGTSAFISPQSWHFQSRYSDFRKKILFSTKWDFVFQLGPHSFETISGEQVNVSLSSITNSAPSKRTKILGLNLTEIKSPDKKAKCLERNNLISIAQHQINKNPDHRIIFKNDCDGDLLGTFAHSWQGIKTSDDERFCRFFWEFNRNHVGWHFYQRAPKNQEMFAGRQEVIFWEDGLGKLSEICQKGASFRGKSAWGKKGIAVCMMGKMTASIYTGEKFSADVTIIEPKDSSHLLPIWALCSSPNFSDKITAVDPGIKATNTSFGKITIDLDYWKNVALRDFPGGLPEPFTNDPTQWLFNGYPTFSSHTLQVAVARIAGFQWPRQTGSSFPDCPALASDGLEALADGDGIVCLSPIRGEAAAADRLRSLLAAAFGDEWSNSKERELLLETAVANDARKAAADLGDWLRQNFFAEHCKLFQSRPFIWQIWDGNPHGFSALVNYHKLAAPNGQGRKTLELLAYTYLGDWIDRQKLDQAEGINGADDRLAAALDLQGQLKKILEGEPPYDIFVRWKPLHQQSIGWDPDINDGVRLNIRPFLNAQLRKGGKAGAGILRAKPGTIKWKKDRGKEPIRSKDDFPWFWGWDENNTSLAINYGAPIFEAPAAGDSFDGNRWNDLHYTRAAKEAARARHRGEA